MLQKANKTNYFSYQKELHQNPYIGMMSFQHFRGDPLYSDMVVLPERNGTETEHYECYPIPDYVEEKGYEQGYHPDTSVVYIRILWKEFEPEQGKYNYAFIQSILDKAKAAHQTLIFRLMAHSTRACDDVPEWLKALIVCPERPEGKRVKDSPTDPLFLELFCLAVRKIAERFDSDPTLDAIDISLPGSWGEGHNLHLYSKESLQNLFDTYTDGFRQTRLIGQIARPELLRYAQSKALVGWRGDGFGEPYHIYELYPAMVEQVSDLWQTSPVSFESYWWLGEWKRRGWDIDEIISLTLQWHASSFNAKSLPIPNEWRERVDAWVAKMGYHYTIDYFKLPETAQAADSIELKLGLDNVGVAPIYRRHPLQITLCGKDFCHTKQYDEVDITKWLPGKIAQRLVLDLPADMPKGEYEVRVSIAVPVEFTLDGSGTLCFATDAPRKDGAYTVGTITIV